MRALFVRDFQLAVRAGGGMLVGVLFFLAVVAVVPFGVGPDLELLARIGPAILWIGALLATLLGLDRLFQNDLEDGSLDLILMQETPLPFVVFVKCLAHWCATGLPLVLATPFLGLLMNMDLATIGAVALTLLAGSPAVTFIGAVGAATTIVLPRGGLLVSILILPLTVPVLIFGVIAAYGAVDPLAPFRAPFLILCAIGLFFAVLGPVAAAAALRSGAD